VGRVAVDRGRRDPAADSRSERTGARRVVADDAVVAVGTGDDVIATEAADGVSAGRVNDRVVAAGSPDIARRPDHPAANDDPDGRLATPTDRAERTRERARTVRLGASRRELTGEHEARGQRRREYGTGGRG